MKVKSNSVITHKVNGRKIDFTVLGAGSFTFDADKANADLRVQAEMHGWTQRISDKAAIGQIEGVSDVQKAQMKFDAMKACADHYMTGTPNWSMASSVAAPNSQIVRAIAEVYNLELADVLPRVAKLAEKAGQSIHKFLNDRREGTGPVAVVYRRIRDAETPIDPTGDALLDELANAPVEVEPEVHGATRTKFKKSTQPSQVA